MQAEGLAISHLNAHQHVHLWPTISPIVVALALDNGVSAIRIPEHAPVVGAPVNLLARRLRAEVVAAGLTAPGYLAGLAEAGGMTLAIFKRAIIEAATSDLDVVEIACHPGEAVDPDRHRYDWDYHWGSELDAVCDPSLRRMATDLGLVLGGFRDLVSR